MRVLSILAASHSVDQQSVLGFLRITVAFSEEVGDPPVKRSHTEAAAEASRVSGIHAV